MKKVKIETVILFVIIILIVASIIWLKPVSDLDELWNYSFAKNVSNGLVPYRDFNMLQMPLLPLVCGLILKISIKKLFIMRIIAILMCSFIIFIIYKIFDLLNIKKSFAVIFSLFILFLYNECLCIDYNWATLLVLLLIIYNEIKSHEKYKTILNKNKIYNLFIGILAGITVTLKQTSGALICIIILLNQLIEVKNKEYLKIYFQNLIMRILGILIPIISMFLYLIINNALYDFINYTLKGAKEFSNYISYKNLITFDLVSVFAIIIPIFICFELYNVIIKEKNINSYILFIYGLSIFIIVFPISDKVHFLIGTTPIIILMIYEIYNLLKQINIKRNKIKLLNKLILIIYFLLIIGSIFYSLHNFYNYYKSRNNFSTVDEYKYIIIPDDLNERVIKTDNYILKSDKRTIILDANAVLYMLPINRYNKNYDMLLKGNIGENGENKILDDIKMAENTQYLLLKNKYSLNWQVPIELIKYVLINKNKIGEIGIFDIYE